MRSAVTFTVSVDLYSVPLAVPSDVHFANVQPAFVGFFGHFLLLAIAAPYVLSYWIVFAFVSAYADAAEPSEFHPFHVPPFSLNVIVNVFAVHCAFSVGLPYLPVSDVFALNVAFSVQLPLSVVTFHFEKLYPVFPLQLGRLSVEMIVYPFAAMAVPPSVSNVIV